MKNEEKKLEILKPYFFGKNDPKNPKNIDAGKKLEETKRKIKEERANKKIIIDGKED